ncbi:MAG: DUF2971 domain-containing protein [Balneolaceae bacterium]|nr:DUF2971 domain-containing protein [Balneolaceae bacterium]
MAYKSRPVYLQHVDVVTPELQEEINSFLNTWLKKHSLEDDLLLYHYTDLSGLQGIIKEREIWISHISSLNDPLEVKYGQELIINELNERILNENDEDLREFFNSMRISVGAFGKVMFHTFIACFCESENLLSQWRAYSNKGGGYNIGFEFKLNTFSSLNKKNLDNKNKPLLRKVIYDKELQICLIRNYLEKITNGVKKGFTGSIGIKNKRNLHAAIMGSQASNVLLDMLLTFKNPEFEEEQEWRLIHVSLSDHQPEQLKFREGANGLIPYKAMSIYDLREDSISFPLKSIMIGPSLDKEGQNAAITLYVNYSTTIKNPISILNPQLIRIKDAGYDLR